VPGDGDAVRLVEPEVVPGVAVQAQDIADKLPAK